MSGREGNAIDHAAKSWMEQNWLEKRECGKRYERNGSARAQRRRNGTGESHRRSSVSDVRTNVVAGATPTESIPFDMNRRIR
jgi:hypothetical protein